MAAEVLGRTAGTSLLLLARRLDAMDLANSGSQIALIVYSGPKTYCQYYQCVGYSNTWWYKHYCGTPKKDPYCGVDLLTHFSNDTTKLKKFLDDADFPQRGTYTTNALRKAKLEL